MVLIFTFKNNNKTYTLDFRIICSNLPASGSLFLCQSSPSSPKQRLNLVSTAGTSNFPGFLASIGHASNSPDWKAVNAKGELALTLLPTMVPQAVYRDEKKTIQHSTEESRTAFIHQMP
ncbi:hypothetical protein QQF64_013261, partial [Cirrhinus molitorella]